MNESQLIAALQEAMAKAGTAVDDDGWLTSTEIQELTGRPIRSVRRALKSMVQDGVVIVQRVPKRNIVGEYSPVVAYKFVKEDR